MSAGGSPASRWRSLSTVQTNAVSDAAPAGQQRSLPLVVLSPGYTGSRSTLTVLAEDLASHGYVVTGIDHTYESLGHRLS